MNNRILFANKVLEFSSCFIMYFYLCHVLLIKLRFFQNKVTTCSGITPQRVLSPDVTALKHLCIYIEVTCWKILSVP